jgi:hypothetical protein
VKEDVAVTTETPITVVEGLKGKAEIFSVKGEDGQPAYEVRFAGKRKSYVTIGEAYLDAGEQAGVKT